MVTHYVEDYDGKRNADAVDPAPAETPASPVEEAPAKATAKVVTAETDAKQSTKKTATAKTKG